MTSHTKAFGRSLPRDMQEDRAAALVSAGLGHELDPTPLWKVNDHRAGKSGPCQAVYWVKERPASNDLKRSSSSSASAAAEKKWDTGSVYKGEWLANRKHGYGTQIWSNGNKYEGEWADGKREGHGILWLREKPTPEQKKKMEEKAQAAALVSSSSSSSAAAAVKNAGAKKLRRVYAGNWKNDLKDGQHARATRVRAAMEHQDALSCGGSGTKLTHLHSLCFFDNFAVTQPGLGVYFYPDGSRYEGLWSEGVRCGRGTLYSPNGDSYTGEWALDKQNGFGTLTKANRDVYEGQWLAGMREGSGLYYYKAQEKIYDGEWANDQPRCGVYTDAKEFFDEEAEDARFQAAQGDRTALGKDGKPLSREEDRARLATAAQAGSAGGVSPRVPRNKPGMPIPRLRMEDADAVLAEAIERVAVDRAAVRSLPDVQLSSLFNEGSMDALRRLFAAYDHNLDTGNGSGQLRVAHLHPMLGELGLPAMSAPVFAQLLTDLRKTSPPVGAGAKDSNSGSGSSTIGFKEFVQAVHLMEERRNIQNAQEAQQLQIEEEQAAQQALLQQ